jgi:hypothetical protein
MSKEKTDASTSADPSAPANSRGGLAIAAIGFFMLVLLVAANMNC